ncbi:MAG: hypothetical protein K8H86_12655, partial [Ignavibacteriaceae bacterium]|nr:hypothetical protein [Ignavibacteriaceae bacterium]
MMNNLPNILIYLSLSFFTFFNLGGERKVPIEQESNKVEEIISTIKISVVGDLMCHSVQYNYAKIEG